MTHHMWIITLIHQRDMYVVMNYISCISVPSIYLKKEVAPCQLAHV